MFKRKGGGDEMVASPCYLKGRGMEWPPFYMNEHICFPQGIKLIFIEQLGFSYGIYKHFHVPKVGMVGGIL